MTSSSARGQAAPGYWETPLRLKVAHVIKIHGASSLSSLSSGTVPVLKVLGPAPAKRPTRTVAEDEEDGDYQS